MSYKQNSSRLRRLPDFFGITDSSGLIPLSRIWDNGILNNQLPALPPEQEKELDKVKEPPNKRRSREREER